MYPYPNTATAARVFRHPLGLFFDSFQRAANERSVRVLPTPEGWEICVELPGAAAEDVKVEATADTVSLRFQVSPDAPEGWTLVRRERPSTSFVDAFRFPQAIDVEQVAATARDGVLTVRVPRSVPATRAVPVLVN